MKPLFLFFITMVSLMAQEFYPKNFSLNGTWNYHINHEPQAINYIYNFSDKEPTLTLPNNWYKEGINHAGIIWFKRQFNKSDLPNDLKHFVHFKGVDYLCDVWINEEHIGSHKGYFQSFEFDINDALKDGANTITVKVNSPLENYPEHYSLHKTLLRGIFSHHDTRPGGAWSAEGQDRNSGGIWNDITIKSYDQHKIENLKVTPTLKENSVELDLAFALTRFQEKFFSFDSTKQVSVQVKPKNFEGESYEQSFNLNLKSEQHLKMNLNDAKLWYTHDRGFPHLYELTLTVGSTKLTQEVGFKSLVQNKEKAHFLNGTAIFLKGTNYISSQYMSEMNEAALRKDLELMKAAHINTIRVHAHIEPERFYKLCDEMGFLVWQDYNLQWGYSDSPAFHKEAIKQAFEMVDLLYNHVSIYIWSMHNEPPWNSEWMKWKYPDYDAEQNKELDEKLYQAISNYDHYHLSKKLSSNLEHPWFAWYSGKYKDFVKDSKVPVITEYGAQAIPNFESLKKFVPGKYLKPKGKKAKKHWEYHNFQFNWSAKNGVKFNGSVKEFIKDSQTYQADLLKFATEMLRIQKYTKTTAIFQFMFNEGWESMNWGIVDYYRQTKPGYEALKKAYAPVITVAKQTAENNLEFYVVNDLLQNINNAELSIDVDNGFNTKTYNYPVNISNDAVVKLASLTLQNDLKITLTLKDENKKIIANNAYNFSPFKPNPKKEK